MVPFLDDSGPTLYVNTASSLTINHLTPLLEVLHKRTVSADFSEVNLIPHMTASEMKSKGIFQGIFYLVVLIFIFITVKILFMIMFC